MDDTFEGCLALPLAGVAESLAVFEDGEHRVILVATEDAGVWAYRLGGC